MKLRWLRKVEDMASKYYAVKEGRNIGVYETWEECKAQVDGYSGADYKSFKNIEEARVYAGITVKNDYENVENIPFTNTDEAIAYVDGSFNVATNEFSYGAVIFHNGNEIHLSKKYDDEELATMRNVAGEIYGSMAAMKYAYENGVKKLTIYHDYEGIAKWCQGLWKTNKEGTINYKRYYDAASKRVKIEFVKVKGHSGDKYNDLADKLAKEAVGIE